MKYKIRISILLLSIFISSYSVMASEDFFSNLEFESVDEYLLAADEFVNKRPNSTYCDLNRNQLGRLRHELALYSEIFNKKATSCLNSLSSKPHFKCLKANLDNFRSIRTCKRIIESRTNGMNKSNHALEEKNFQVCKNNAQEEVREIYANDECNGYKPLRNTKNLPNDLTYTFTQRGVISFKWAPRISAITKESQLDEKNKIKADFSQCFRQAWFDTRADFYNNSKVRTKNRQCYTNYEIGSCFFNTVRNRFRCVFNRSPLTSKKSFFIT